MANPGNADRRIIGVRTSPNGNLLFCEAGKLTPQIGDWVTIQGENGKFPAQVVLPGSLLESAQLPDNLLEAVGLAVETELVEAGISSAIEAAASRKFGELSAANNWPYTLKEVISYPDRLVVNFVAEDLPDSSDYASIFKSLAAITKTRIELYRVKKDSLPDRPPAGPEFVGWVNRLLKPLDSTILAGAAVEEPLLDESEVYRPGGSAKSQQNSIQAVNGPGQKVLHSEVILPDTSYDPVKRETWTIYKGLTRSMPIAHLGFKYKGSVYTVVIRYADNDKVVPLMVKNDDERIILDIEHLVYDNVKALEAEIISKIDLWLLDSNKVKSWKLGEKYNQPVDRGDH